MKKFVLDLALKKKLALLKKGVVTRNTIWDKIVFKLVVFHSTSFDSGYREERCCPLRVEFERPGKEKRHMAIEGGQK